MDDSLLADSVFEDGDSSDFEPPVKAKAKPKPAPKKAAARSKAGSKKLAQTTLKTVKPRAPKKRKKQDSDGENSEPEPSRGAMDDESLLADTPPSAKRLKKAPAPKKSSSKPLEDIENDSHAPTAASNKPTTAANSSDRYQKLTPLEHILKRPDTYIGSVERTETRMWVFNSETESMELREVGYVPGLYKIFDEILVNAADNKQNDKNMDEIKVTVNRETGEISVRNNGRGIPIEVHEKHGIHIPEMIFGHLLTSSNYDDDQRKVTGGRNGYGAKLCNIFSTKFTIETVDSKKHMKYHQTWTNNMSVMGKAKITTNKSDDYTKVTFTPDFAKFQMSGIDDDFEALVKRRVYDLAGTVRNVKVYLNGDRIKINTFRKYVEMHAKALRAEQGDTNPGPKDATLTERVSDRWDVGFAVSDGSFQQVSFVNSIATTSGGTHVNYVADQIVEGLAKLVKKRNKGGFQLKPNQIKNHIFLFVNCLVENPAFTSQTKEQLTTKKQQFGSKCELSEKFLKSIEKTEVIDNILHFAQKKADQVLKKSDGSRRSRMNNSKLTDANKAGTKEGYKCTLILTEGDSASLLALAGRAVVSPDYFGVFPLRGKMLNVRDASLDAIAKNQEIQNIKKFMGLQHKKEYKDTKDLRYGHLMIMTDQDHDGSHIKGLLINFLQVQFPSLLKIDGFLMEFITPIVKVWKGDSKNPKQLRSFFTMPEWEAWKKDHAGQRGWDHKYFKGLGTSDTKDAEIYFRDLDTHLKEFHTMKDQEADLIDMVFSKKKADARKEWLRNFQIGTYLDTSLSKKISYDDFVNKELILFSNVDNFRSIPSVLDGFKPSQRKVMYTCFKLNIKKEVKVFSLGGYVMAQTAYQYGDSSMQQTIVGLAQTFVGSNNVNILDPSGNFGSRRQGGNDAASPRYIYTRPSPFARKIFHPADDALLTHDVDDGKKIEPHWYIPVVPMLLINGADGIGTGWSTSVPNYKPEDIVENLKRRMAGNSKEDMLPMNPWFRGWSGEVQDIGNDRWKFPGTIRQISDTELEVTELPIRYWTQDFKDKLEDILKAEKVPSFIKDYTDHGDPERVHFVIKMEEKNMATALQNGLEETFKLSKTMATTNLVAFDSQGRIHKYSTVLDIMEEFFHVRLRMYEKRKQHLLDTMQKDLDKWSNQARFIRMIIDGKLVVAKKKKKDLIAELKRLNFKPFPKIADAIKAGEDDPVAQNENDDQAPDESEEDVEVGANDYDYLLGMAIWSLTYERYEKLLNQIKDKEVEMDALIKLSPKDLWMADLDAFLEEWHMQLAEEQEQNKKRRRMGRRASAKLGLGFPGAKPAKSRRRKGENSDDSDADFAVTKPKKKAVAANKAQPKPSSLMSYLTRAETPQSEVKSEELKSEENEPDVPAVLKKARAAAAKAKMATKAMPTPSDDDEDEDDMFAAIAKEVKHDKPAGSTTLPSRHARAVTKKPAKYVLSDDDESDGDNGDDMLGDVSAMVKGIGNGSNDSNNPRQLFSASLQRPSSSSSHNISTKAISRATNSKLGVDQDSDIDDTDFTKLVPQPSPQRPAIRKASEAILSADDDESFSLPPPPKQAPKPAAKIAKASTSTTRRGRPPGSKNPPKSATATKKAPTVKAAAAAPKKMIPLSPAAKAYAKKQEKILLPPRLKKGKNTSDEEDDVNALANDILSDGDDMPARAPAPRAATRPGRRAATQAKSKYVITDDESSDNEDSFVVDDSD